MKVSAFRAELMGLINPDSEIEIEKVERYINLVKIYKELDKTLKRDGYMIIVKNGAQSYLKANSAIGEKVKINQALIKLGEFFDKKQELKNEEGKKKDFANPKDFL